MKFLVLALMVATATAVTIKHVNHVYNEGGAEILEDGQIIIKGTPLHPIRLALGIENGAYGHLDAHGVYKGLWLDILKEICLRARKTCHMVIDRYEHCWVQDEHYLHYEYPGVGLMDHYYDGCVGYFASPVRLNSVNFTIPMHPPSTVAVLVDPAKFTGEKTNLLGKKMGRVRGWISYAQCLSKQTALTGVQEGEYTVVNHDTLHDVIVALRKGLVDFTVIPTDMLNVETERLHIVQPTFTCSTTGYGIMAPYGNPIIPLFNKYFTIIKNDGTLARLCTAAKTLYGTKGPIICPVPVTPAY